MNKNQTKNITFPGEDFLPFYIINNQELNKFLLGDIVINETKNKTSQILDKFLINLRNHESKISDENSIGLMYKGVISDVSNILYNINLLYKYNKQYNKRLDFRLRLLYKNILIILKLFEEDTLSILGKDIVVDLRFLKNVIQYSKKNIPEQIRKKHIHKLEKILYILLKYIDEYDLHLER